VYLSLYAELNRGIFSRKQTPAPASHTMLFRALKALDEYVDEGKNQEYPAQEDVPEDEAAVAISVDIESANSSTLDPPACADGEHSLSPTLEPSESSTTVDAPALEAISTEQPGASAEGQNPISPETGLDHGRRELDTLLMEESVASDAESDHPCEESYEQATTVPVDIFAATVPLTKVQ
jgi:hypothetical protein